MTDLLMKGARVVDPLNHRDGIFDVAVENGRIEEVAPTINRRAEKTYDFTGLVLQPGIIDAHVHIGSIYGSPYGHRMLAEQGVTTALDMAGPIKTILEEVPEYGTGLNVAIVEADYPVKTLRGMPRPTEREIATFIDSALDAGAFGIKLLGGMTPITPEISASILRRSYEAGAYIAWHAGSTEHGSNIEGMKETIELLGDMPLHLAHINAYCRGGVRDCDVEAQEAIDMLLAHPQVISESYLSPMNGTRLAFKEDGHLVSSITASCLTRFGFEDSPEGLKRAFRAHHAYVNYDTGRSTELLTGEEGIAYWLKRETRVTGGFNVNPFGPRTRLATAKRANGTFVVDAIGTDGGVIPRNVILSHGLALVKLGGLTLSEFVVKNSLNPARMLRLAQKGHLSVGADADITVYDAETGKPIAAFVAGSPTLLEGKLPGRGATFITTARGEAALKAKGHRTIVVDLSVPYVRAMP